MDARNPATDMLIASYPELAEDEIDQRLQSAQTAFRKWSTAPFAERARLMMRAADTLESRRDELADLMTSEMGKIVREARAEVEKCAWVCRYYGDNAEAFLRSESVETDAKRSRVVYRPLGVILAVMPWNFPFWQVFRFAAPGLMAGNACVLKHASNVPGCALAIEEVLSEAGLPDGLFASLLVGSGAVAGLVARPEIRGVTLTGSTEAGSAVARVAGQHIKKTVLELGGSDPYLILEDADLEQAVRTCVAGRMVNGGQSCIAAKRLIVVEPIADRFERMVIDAMKRLRMGDPTDAETDLGPLARRELRDKLHEQVCRSVDTGAELALGGQVPDGPGAFYPPTVLTQVAPGMPAYDEETFGPVAAVIRASSEDEAIRIANDSPFGLGAAVFTRDVERGERIAADRLDAGCCFVNASVRSDPRLPFGGIKSSGYGRELSHQGIREFVNAKTVYVA